MKAKKTIYADHSATTPVRQEVVEAMLPLFNRDFGNPSSIHSFGKHAKVHLETARENIANVINSSPEEIFFTSGGTESDNIVLLGIAKLIEENKLKKDKHLITTKIEHTAVKTPAEYLQSKGWKISWLDVNNEGFIDTNELKSLIRNSTALVSIIHANNEIGTIQDLKTISEICKNRGVLFHSDTVQSFCKIPIDVKHLNLDFISMSSHKIYGPKGIGALYINSSLKLPPLIMGGGQENNMRSGTENLPGIVGFATASRLLSGELEKNAKYLRSLQIKLMEGLLKINKSIEDRIILTGPGVENRLPGHTSICCKNIEGENLVLQADLKGIALSSGSACSSKETDESISNFEPSHVIKAIGVPFDYENGSLRITLGKSNTEEEVLYIIESIQNILEKLNKKILAATS